MAVPVEIKLTLSTVQGLLDGTTLREMLYPTDILLEAGMLTVQVGVGVEDG